MNTSVKRMVDPGDTPMYLHASCSKMKFCLNFGQASIYYEDNAGEIRIDLCLGDFISYISAYSRIVYRYISIR